MKIFASIVLMIIMCGGVGVADDSAVGHIGGMIRPMDEHPSVRLVAEHVQVRVFKNHSLVDCVFFLKNEGPETDVEMGFPCYEDQQSKSEFEYFRSYVNGREVDIEKSVDETEWPQIWYCKKVHFGDSELVTVRNVYKGKHSWDTNLEKWFDYVLHTGASWRGSIGSVSVVVTLEEINPDKVFKIEPPGYEREGNEIRWTLSNYEPQKKWDVINLTWDGNEIASITSDIHRKAAQGDIEGVKYLIEQGVDINMPRELTKTPLIDAIWFGAGPEMVRFLAENGAALEADHDRNILWSPLSTALMVDDKFHYPFTVDVVRALLDHGARVDHRFKKQIERSSEELKALLTAHYQE